MSDVHKGAAQTSSHPPSSTAIDLLLVIDTVTLLERHPATNEESAPASVDSSFCYCFAPGKKQIVASNDGTLAVKAPPGTDLRLRWSPLSLRGERIILLDISLSDNEILGPIAQHVDERASLFMPQLNSSGTMDEPAKRTAPDIFWKTKMIAPGAVDARINARIMGRDAHVLGNFFWDLRLTLD